MVNGNNSSSSRVPKASLDALLKSLDESLAVRGLQGVTVNVLPHLQQAGALARGITTSSTLHLPCLCLLC